MNALRLPRYSACATYLVASALVAIGVWVFFRQQGKSGFDTIPLFWLVTVVTAPFVSIASVITMWRQKASPWMTGCATLLLFPQVVVWYFAVRGLDY